MATTVIGELSQGRRLSIDNTLKREATRAFIVRTDTPVRGGLEVLIALGVDFGDPYRTLNTSSGEYEYDTGLEMYRVEAEPYDPDDYTVWKITVYYSSDPPDPALFTAGGATNINTQGGGGSNPAGGDGQNESPLAEPAKVVWGKSTRLVAMAKALNDPPTNRQNKFVTGAGQPFSKNPEIDFGMLSLTITRNEADFDAVDREQYWETTNAWPFYGFLANSVLCTSITGFRDYRNKTIFWPVTYQFLLDSTGNAHKWRPVNKGTQYLTTGDDLTTRKDNPSNTGRPQEVFLRADGTVLPDASDPVVLDFTIYAESNFDDLVLE